MKRLLFLAFFVTSVSIHAQPAKIIILRHSEKLAGEDEGLSLKGEERAAALVPYLTKTPGLVESKESTVVFATRIGEEKTDNHTHETMEPLAAALGLKIKAPFANSQFQALAKFITTDPSCKGKTVVVCWTHAYIPKLVAGLGIQSKLEDWDKLVFDRLLVITGEPGNFKMVNSPQRLMFGDSPK